MRRGYDFALTCNHSMVTFVVVEATMERNDDALICKACGGTGEEGECYLDGPNVVSFSDDKPCRRCRGTGAVLCALCTRPAVAHDGGEFVCASHGDPDVVSTAPTPTLSMVELMDGTASAHRRGAHQASRYLNCPLCVGVRQAVRS